MPAAVLMWVETIRCSFPGLKASSTTLLSRVSSGCRWRERPEAVRLDAGDCVLLTGGHPCCLTSDPSLPATDVSVFKSAIRDNGDIVTLNGGGDSLTLGGHFLLSGLHAKVLLDLLPPVIHIRKESIDPAFHWSLDLLMRELRTSRPGSSLVEQHLASLILIEALRVYLSRRFERHLGVAVRSFR